MLGARVSTGCGQSSVQPDAREGLGDKSVDIHATLGRQEREPKITQPSLSPDKDAKEENGCPMLLLVMAITKNKN